MRRPVDSGYLARCRTCGERVYVRDKLVHRLGRGECRQCWQERRRREIEVVRLKHHAEAEARLTAWQTRRERWAWVAVAVAFVVTVGLLASC